MIIITIGIDGSGKSHWSKEFIKNNSEWELISLDNTHNKYVLNQINETELIKELNVVINNIMSCLFDKKNLVFDLSFCDCDINNITFFLTALSRLTKEIEFKIFYCDPELAYKIIESDLANGIDRPNWCLSELETQYKNYKQVVKYLKEENYTLRMF